MKHENFIKTILSLLSMVFLIYIGSNTLKWMKFDQTQENLYTLSEGTIHILKKLDSPVKLKLYYSKVAANKGSEALRGFNNHFYYVRELLKEYVRHSRNNLTLQVVDPRPDTSEEEEAMAHGLKQFQLTDTERYFFGLVAESETGTEKTIEFFNPEVRDRLEYDLTKLIYVVQKPQKKTVGIISSLPVMAEEEMNPYVAQIMRMQGRKVENSWIIVRLLKDFYNLERIKSDVNEISNIDTLVVIHPLGFPKKTLFAIDQYLMRGGNLVVLTDPHAVSDARARGGFGSSSPDEGFQKLMDKWGVEVPQHMFAGDKYLSGMGQVSRFQRPQRLLALLNCNQTCAAHYKEPISSGLQKVTFVYPGVVRKKGEIEGLTINPILSTSDKGNSYTAYGRELNNPTRLWEQFSEGKEPVVVGQKIVGRFKTAFPNGISPEDWAEPIDPDKDKEKQKRIEREKEKKDPPELVKESSKESAIVLFSDVDFISDSFAFKQTFVGLSQANNNSTLFLNSVEALSGDKELMSVRSKGRVNRSFDVIEDIEFAAEKKTAAKVKEIQASITNFQSELNQLGRKAHEGNIALLQNEGVKKKKELAKNIASLKNELRSVKREGREKIEMIGKVFQYINTLLGPFLVFLFAIWYSHRRKKRMGSRSQALDKEGAGSERPFKKCQI